MDHASANFTEPLLSSEDSYRLSSGADKETERERERERNDERKKEGERETNGGRAREMMGGRDRESKNIHSAD